MYEPSKTAFQARSSRRALVGCIGGGALGLTALALGRRQIGAMRQVSTPAAASASDPFRSLLDLVPDPYPAAMANPFPLFYYADIAGQLASVGLTAPTDPESEEASLWTQVTLGLSLPPDPGPYLFAIDWEGVFGWSPFQIEQSLWFGEPPEVAMLLRGPFDAAAVEAALLKLGYRAVEVPGATAAYSIEHKDLGFEDDVERFLSLSALRTLAILPDGAFVWGQRPGPVRAVAAVAAGAPSLLDRTPIASLLGAVEPPLASSLLIPGNALAGAAFDPTELLETAATPDTMDELATAIASAEAARREMPPVGFTLLGIDYGGEFSELTGTPVALPIEPTPNRVRFYLQFVSQDDAATAAAVIERRLAKGRSLRADVPWSELFQGWEISVVGDRPIVLIALEVGDRRSIWFNLLYSRDLGFLAW
jgi:hypothetical protein